MKTKRVKTGWNDNMIEKIRDVINKKWNENF